jgi:hypothetical protein
MLVALRQLQLSLGTRIYAALAVGSAGIFVSKYTMPHEVNYAGTASPLHL